MGNKHCKPGLETCYCNEWGLKCCRDPKLYDFSKLHCPLREGVRPPNLEAIAQAEAKPHRHSHHHYGADGRCRDTDLFDASDPLCHLKDGVRPPLSDEIVQATANSHHHHHHGHHGHHNHHHYRPPVETTAAPLLWEPTWEEHNNLAKRDVPLFRPDRYPGDKMFVGIGAVLTLVLLGGVYIAFLKRCKAAKARRAASVEEAVPDGEQPGSEEKA